MTRIPPSPRTQRGMALVMVMLLTVAVAALVGAAIFLSSGAAIVSKGQESEEDMRNAADAGIEMGRSALNGTPSLFPDTGYAALQLNAPVTDASGAVIPGVTRSIYYGPTGSSTGQYGVFGSVVSLIQNRGGAVVVRRGELAQESFARFAYYSNSEASGTICFGGGDQIFGPLHTNDNMCIYSSGARFRSEVEVSGTINVGRQYGTFDQGYIEHGAVIPMPTVAALSRLNTYATQGGMSFTAPTGGSPTPTAYQARMRIEFLPVDLDGDGRVTGPTEGFFRVYSDTGASNPDYVTATEPANVYDNKNCTDVHTVTGGSPANPSLVHYTSAWHLLQTSSPGSWFTSGVSNHTTTSLTNVTNRQYNAISAVQQAGSRCWLGGDEHLFVTSAAGGYVPRNTFQASDTYGRWLPYTTTPDPSVIAGLKNPATGTIDTTLANRTLLAQYLWPLSRQFNPNSKGVIYVTGRVVLSGVVNGKVTVASSDNIIIGDDLKYAIAPGSAPCIAANMLGLLSPGYIYLANNELNAPQRWGGTPTNLNLWKSYASTSDEYIQGVLLALSSFQVEAYDDYSSGPTSQEPCGTTPVGRGCLALTGGLIQQVRGAVGTTAGSGYVKRYAYDACAFQTPPPYFPTTGRFKRNRYYEIDPVGFDVGAFFRSLTPN